MRIVVVGGGPAGAYFAILLKRADPEGRHHVTVLERNPRSETYGWGVVFSDATLEALRAADPISFHAIADHFARWDDIDIHVRDATITSGGHGFCGIARSNLLAILRERAESLGAELRFEVEARGPEDLDRLGLGDADLIVAADGVNSAWRLRDAAHFQPDLDVRTARYLWLGTTKRFDAFTFIFRETPQGVFQAHAYRFDEKTSAFIVECDERSWKAAGMETADIDRTLAFSQELFGDWLDGHRLEHNAPHQRAAPWQRFTRVRCAHWYHDNVILLGDAAHTAHFSIGSGTKLAMEDAISLVNALASSGDPTAALERYQEERSTDALRLQNAARNSMEWFENVRRYIRLDPPQFAYSLLTRSQRISHENLRLRDRNYLESVERWFASRASVAAEPHAAESPAPPPLFTPFRLRGLTLENRIAVGPMDMYSAQDGMPNEFHLVHLGARALGGAALVFTEMTCVTPDGRISPGCTGMYHDDHADAWRRIVDFVHSHSRAAVCLQLGHSGRKGSTKFMWEGMDEPLAERNWPVMGPSPEPYGPGMQVPREMTRADMEAVCAAFVRATRMGADAGFDMLELHCAHGYLLSSFLTPLSNHRTDAYGGSFENRMRYPLEVCAAMRAVWPDERPMSVRISATDWVDGGITGDDAVRMARAFHESGADIIHVSTGQTSADARPVYGRMFQTPFSDRIRNEAGIPTIAVGNITEADQVNSIIAAGRADLCALARPHLADPQWTLRAAAELGYDAQPWPVQYRAGKSAFERALKRQAEARLTEARAAVAAGVVVRRGDADAAR